MLVMGRLPGDSQVSVGSGTLIAGQLVLTAAHVVFDKAGRPLAELYAGPPDQELLPCTVLCPATYVAESFPDNRDYALLKLTDPGEKLAAADPIAWGRLTGRAAEVSCEAIGFPRVLRLPDGMRETDHLSGRINPGSRRIAGRYDIHVTSAVPNVPINPKMPSEWSGTSGAGVFAAGYFIGVINVDEPGYPSNRLSVIPAHTLAANRELKLLVEGAEDGAPLHIASVELGPLLAPPQRLKLRWPSPAVLLQADAESVPFRGRENYLSRLTTWRESEKKFDVALLVGPGGQGKTRLARKLVDQSIQDGWQAGFLVRDPKPPGNPLDLSVIASAAVPLFLVVDYADTRTFQLARLFSLMDTATDLGRHRLLLLARSSGEWWRTLRTRRPELLSQTDIHPLATLDDNLESRHQAFGEALDSFARILAQIDSPTAWAEVASTVPDPPDLDADHYGAPLTLQMSALLALLDLGSTHGSRFGSSAGSLSLEQRILDHEQTYWEDSATDLGVDLHHLTLSTVVAAAALLGAGSEREARAVLDRVPGVRDKSEEVKNVTRRWLKDLYPPSAGELHWGTIQPDRVAEHLVGWETAESAELLACLLQDATEAQLFRAMTMLLRATSHQPHLIDQFRRILENDPERLEPVALAVAEAFAHQPSAFARDMERFRFAAGVEDGHGVWSRLLRSMEVSR